ncbi:2-keto-4-pentenoate hydratase [Lutimaribacter marinistellae]|uniref:2-keto-4-pentenoate hydratase n=1 Tax=Lutimaribacter marinistellae TaxID=1820329 RepID=A0ABV7TG94_9RHOB
MTLETVATALREAEEGAFNIPPVRDRITTAEEAYAVQEINTKARLAAGGRLVGRKVGLTNPAVQAQLGVDQPDYGMLFADMEVMHDAMIPWSDAAQYKVEAEIAFILGRDLAHEQITSADLIRAIDWVVPAIEIVGSRIQNWDIRFVDTVADNGSSAHFVLGSGIRRPDAVDLVGCKMHMAGSDGSKSEGTGAACYGSPLNAALWLARVMQAADRSLKAGDVVLSGALGPMIAATPGTRYEASIDGLGKVAVQFGDAA